MDFNILKTELQDISYINLTDTECTNILNAVNVGSKHPISTTKIKQYLMLSNLWLELKHSTSDSAETAIDAINSFDEFDVKNSDILAMLTTVLNNLETDITNFTNTNTTEILALGDTTISKAESLGLSVVALGHVETARVL